MQKQLPPKRKSLTQKKPNAARISTRREFLQQAGAAGIVAVASVPSALAWDDGASSSRTSVRPRHGLRAAIPHIKSLVRREDAIVRYPLNGDCWPITWASDDLQYASLCDGAGSLQPPREMYNSRMFVVNGEPEQARFSDLPGYPLLARPQRREDETRYYGFSALALGGQIYHFMSTFNRALRSGEADRADLNGEAMRYNGTKLIYSPDYGRTWHNQDGSTPVIWEPWGHRSRETMLFIDEDQEAFSLLSVLQMGKGYADNRDGYVYVYAPNGNTDGTMNELVMFRVPMAQIPRRSAYEYFAGLDARGRARWTPDILARKPVHTFPRGWVGKWLHPYSWRPSVVYDAPLGIYLMVNWGTGVSPSGNEWFVKPSYLGFWMAQNPWGPWTQIHEETAWMPAGDAQARCFQPQIAPKWIAPDGKSFWLVWTDLQTVTDGAAMKRFFEEHKHSADPNAYSEADVVRAATALRQDLPYYCFNTQRVDLVV